MKHFLKILYLGLYNLIITVECVLSFCCGVRQFIKIHNATGLAAIGMFLSGIVMVCCGVLLLYGMGYIVEPFFETNKNNKNEEEEEKK